LLIGISKQLDLNVDPCMLQAIPRKIWLDPNGKQLLQWPIEEIEKLRGKPVSVSGKVVKLGQHFEVTGLGAYQVGTRKT
jgi:beta-fructofuranosidase